MSDPPMMPEILPFGDQVIPKVGRYVCRSLGRPKGKSKLLKRALDEAGYKIGLLKCLELVARMYGYANYHELFHTVDGVTCSPDDEAVDEVKFAARYWSKVQKLVEIGVSPLDAEHIIDMVRPTSGTYQAAADVSPSEPLRP